MSEFVDNAKRVLDIAHLVQAAVVDLGGLPLGGGPAESPEWVRPEWWHDVGDNLTAALTDNLDPPSRWHIVRIDALYGITLIGFGEVDLSVLPGGKMLVRVSTTSPGRRRHENEIVDLVQDVEISVLCRCVVHSDCRAHPELGRECWLSSHPSGAS